jgi:hypothetical protein
MRPFLVAMRARKPCVRLRFKTLGWNVRLLMLHLSVYRGRRLPLLRLCREKRGGIVQNRGEADNGSLLTNYANASPVNF